jgi:hypothetical protein
MKRDKDVLWIATPFKMHRPRRDTKDREGLLGHVIRYTIDEPGFALEVFRMGDDKSMRRRLKALARVALLSLIASPASVIAQGTPEARRACTPDALRLCSAFIPDADQITACLRQRNAELSDACRQVILAGMNPSDSSGSVGAQGRIAR